MQQAMNFKLNKIRRRNTDALAFEYLSILSILYGHDIENGLKRVRDFFEMTMLEAENEIRIRTTMTKASCIRKQRQLRADMQQNETNMLEQLKRGMT